MSENSGKIGKREMKKKTRSYIRQTFETNGCHTIDRSAGAVNYVAIRLHPECPNNIAAIYGSRNFAASIWVKDDAFTILKESGLIVADDGRPIKDVSFFKRGLDWQIDVYDDMDSIIQDIIAATMVTGQVREDERLSKIAFAEARAAESVARDAHMNDKRKDPFA